MGNKFDFKSAVCTSKEQSERLLRLGLKEETADMWWCAVVTDAAGKPYPKKSLCWHKSLHKMSQVVGLSRVQYVPAWSLMRLIELMPKWIDYNSKRYYLSWRVGRGGRDSCGDVGYFDDPNHRALDYFYKGETIYDNIIYCMEWLYITGHFNNDYLNETQTDTKED